MTKIEKKDGKWRVTKNGKTKTFGAFIQALIYQEGLKKP